MYNFRSLDAMVGDDDNECAKHLDTFVGSHTANHSPNEAHCDGKMQTPSNINAQADDNLDIEGSRAQP